MLIREIGLLLYGIPVVFKSYHKTIKDGVGLNIRSAYISSIIGYAEKIIAPVDYFESNKYIIVFKKDVIDTFRSDKSEIIAYVVIDRDENLIIKQKHDKYIEAKIQPLLLKVLNEFIKKYTGKDLSNVSAFNSFKENIDKILGTETKTLEQKVATLFFGD